MSQHDIIRRGNVKPERHYRRCCHRRRGLGNKSMPHPDRASLPIAPAKHSGQPGRVRRHVGQLLGREPARIDRAELVKDWLLTGVLLFLHLLDNVTVDETVPRRGGCLVFGVVGFGGAELRFVLDEGRFEINDPLLFGEWGLLRVASGGAG
uniref:(northern house mosquito) hypothetical protein n=1 Tax=Culex pipiens TaxID=7175 RepID=A0A8D8JL05_CULPI